MALLILVTNKSTYSNNRSTYSN